LNKKLWTEIFIRETEFQGKILNDKQTFKILKTSKKKKSIREISSDKFEQLNKKLSVLFFI
jgi:hypothetical protein